MNFDQIKKKLKSAESLLKGRMCVISEMRKSSSQVQDSVHTEETHTVQKGHSIPNTGREQVLQQLKAYPHPTLKEVYNRRFSRIRMDLIELGSQESFLSIGMMDEVLNSVGGEMDFILKEEAVLEDANVDLHPPLQHGPGNLYIIGSDVGLVPPAASPDSTLQVLPTIPSPTSKLPCREEYPGPYNFELEMNSATSGKTRWMYSQLLRKVFVTMESKVPLQFKWTQGEMGLRVRALIVFCSQGSLEDPVLRCPNHSSKIEPSNKDIDHVCHVIRCEHERVEYHNDLDSRRLSVVVPLDLPQPGTDWVTVMYSFMCKNSCPVGMNRRSTEIIFTLERPTGEVIGRRTMKVRICSCPKRDKDKEEKESQPCSSGKRLMDSEIDPPAYKKVKLDSNNDTVSIDVMKKHSVSVAFYAYTLILGHIAMQNREPTEQEKALLEKYHEIVKPSISSAESM